MSNTTPRAAVRHTLRGRLQTALCTVLLAGALALAAPQPAQALMVLLNFGTGTLFDGINNHDTTADSFAGFGFAGLNTSQVRSAALASIQQDYLSYPSTVADAASPLPVGKQLNIDFEIVTSAAGLPSNGDTSFYVVNVGDIAVSQPYVGLGCGGCVRGGASLASAGDVVGAVFTDSIASTLAGLAGNDAQRINLIAGSISHEIGHTLGLAHPLPIFADMDNPGESPFTLMGNGEMPTLMPNSQRILDRAFSYTEFATLVRNVGLRDVTAAVAEPGSAALVVLALAALALRFRGARRVG